MEQRRQAPIEAGEQDNAGSNQHQRRLDERRQPRGDELVDRLQVVDDPWDQLARLLPLVVIEGEALQVAEHLDAEPVERRLSQPVHRPRLEVAADGLHQVDRQYDPDDPQQVGLVSRQHPPVDRQLPQPRVRQRRSHQEQRRDDDQGDAAGLVREKVSEATYRMATWHGF